MSSPIISLNKPNNFSEHLCCLKTRNTIVRIDETVCCMCCFRKVRYTNASTVKYTVLTFIYVIFSCEGEEVTEKIVVMDLFTAFQVLTTCMYYKILNYNCL